MDNSLDNRLVLMNRLSGPSDFPTKSLRLVYTGMINELEKHMDKELTEDVKQQVFQESSAKRIDILSNRFKDLYCKKILASFSDEEIKEMLDQHITFDRISSPILSAQLQTAVAMNKQDLMNQIIEQAKSMANDEWIDDIVGVLDKLGYKSIIKQSTGSPID